MRGQDQRKRDRAKKEAMEKEVAVHSAPGAFVAACVLLMLQSHGSTRSGTDPARFVHS